MVEAPRIRMRFFDKHALEGANFRGPKNSSGVLTLVNMGNGLVSLSRSHDAFGEANRLKNIRAEVVKRRDLTTYEVGQILSQRTLNNGIYQNQLADPAWTTFVVEIDKLNPKVLAELAMSDAETIAAPMKWFLSNPSCAISLGMSIKTTPVGIVLIYAPKKKGFSLREPAKA